MQILCLMDIMGYFKHTCLLCLFLLCVCCVPHDRYVTITGYAQGGTYAVKFNLNGVDGMIPQSPEEIRDSIDAILKAVDSSLSGYNGNSLLSRFNRGEAVKPDSLFVDIYRRGYDIYKSTGGVVDVASAPLFDIWGFGFKTGNFPDDMRYNFLIPQKKSLRRNFF